MKRTLLLIFAAGIAVGAFAAKKKPAPPTLMNEKAFYGIPVGASKSQVTAKGLTCQEVHIGDYLILHECRKPFEFEGQQVQVYAQMNSSGAKAEAVGFDMYFPGDQIGKAQDQFYKFEKAIEAMLGVSPSLTTTPDTYLAMTNFKYSKTVISCYLYSDDRTKPPKLRCGAEVRSNR